MANAVVIRHPNFQRKLDVQKDAGAFFDACRELALYPVEELVEARRYMACYQTSKEAHGLDYPLLTWGYESSLDEQPHDRAEPLALDEALTEASERGLIDDGPYSYLVLGMTFLEPPEHFVLVSTAILKNREGYFLIHHEQLSASIVKFDPGSGSAQLPDMWKLFMSEHGLDPKGSFKKIESASASAVIADLLKTYVALRKS